MAANAPARAMTTDEKTAFRSGKQWSEMGLIIFDAPVVMSCQVNQAFTTWDRVAQVAIDNVLGDVADVLPHMTCFVGSTFGARDKGICRVRKAPTSAVLYIGEVSDIHFEDDDYLTVVDMPAIYPRDLTTDGGVFKMDYDIGFSTSYLNKPIPVLGPTVSVFDVPADIYGDPVDDVEFHPLSPEKSYVLGGATIASYLYACPTAKSITGADTTSPTIVFDSAGWHKWSCTVTDSAGKTATGYRWVCINPTYVDVSTDEWSCDFRSGYWSVRVNTDEDLSGVYERSLAVLISKRDYFDGEEEVVGKLPEHENIELIGWIAEKSVSETKEFGSVQFTIAGTTYWLEKIRSFPSGLTDTSSTPTSWVEVASLTVDKALAHLLTWCTTALLWCDFTLTGDTNRIRTLAAPRGNLLSQMKEIAESTLMANVCVNSYGQTFIQIDAQVLTDSERSAIPTVISLVDSDHHDGVEFEVIDITPTSFLELSGIGAYDGSFAQPYFSHAPGAVGHIYGGDDSKPELVLDDQDDCNFKAGRLLAIANAQVPPFSLRLAGNLKFVDVCPHQFVEVTVSGDYNPLGIAIDALCIPRSVKRSRLKESGDIETRLLLEVVVSSQDGVTYYPPEPELETVSEDGYAFDGSYKVGSFPPIDTVFPSSVPIMTSGGECSGLPNSRTASWSKSEINGTDEDRTATIYYPCKIRPKSYNYASPSRVMPNIKYFGDAQGKVTLYGISGGTRVITADSSFEFDPASPVDVDGFEIELDEGGGFEPIVGDVYASGTVNANSVTGVLISGLSVGSYYAVQGSGGPCNIEPGWYMEPGTYWVQAYDATRRTGAIGYRAGKSPNIADLGGMGVLGEEVSTYHSRVYFEALYPDVYVRVYDYDNPGYYGDNSGSLGYLIYEVPGGGRKITLSSAQIQNVCPPY